MMPYPPLGTITAAGMLRAAGFPVALHDVMLADSEEEIIEALDEHRPRLLVIYDDSFNYLTKMCLSRMREAAFRMASLAKRHGCIVAVFSSDATDHLDEYFRHDVDFVLCGEAELTLADLARSLLRDGCPAPEDIPGLAFPNHGAVVKTAKRPVLKDLDSLPIAAWDLVDLERYRKIWLDKHGYFSLNISTTRGCPFHCNWCAKPLYGQVYGSRSPQSVVNEMKFLREHAGPDHLWITDDIFGLKPGWIQKFDELVNLEQERIPFKCLSRVDLLLEGDTIRHLKNAGCQSVWVGAESGSQKILDAMEKGTTVDQIVTATRLLREAGIRVGFFLQFGYPGEAREDIDLTLKMVKECRPDEIGISVSYPLPGTKFYETVRARMGEKRNWVDSKDLDLMFPGEYHPDFYRTLHTVVHKKFSIWRGMVTIRKFLTAPSKVHKPLRMVGSMMYHGLTLPYRVRQLQRLERIGLHAGNE
jgi:anaerobic magnesium-protoporphyrin IX monomethyl ester cyclase